MWWPASPPTRAKPACRQWPFSPTWTPRRTAPGKNVKPIVHRKYDGRVVKFPDKPRLTLDPATSPELRTAVGKDIVTASGTTLLGSDDKSGVAVIMTLVERLLRETKWQHRLIRVCFTPDEEIGRGVDKLDLRMLGAH